MRNPFSSRLSAPVRDALGVATLHVAAERGWSALRVAEVRDRAALAPDQARGLRLTKRQLANVVAQYLDEQAVREADVDTSGSARERVFDAVMSRFDAMEAHRAGVVAVRQGIMRDPRLIGPAGVGTLRTAKRLLELAGETTRGPVGRLRIKGLAAILVRVSRAWLNETSSDLSRTMAELDRALRDVEDLAGRWPFSMAMGGRQHPSAGRSKGASAHGHTQNHSQGHSSDPAQNAPFSPAADMDA